MVEELESLQGNSLWKRREHCKPHLVNGMMFADPKKDGGLLLGGIANRKVALTR